MGLFDLFKKASPLGRQASIIKARAEQGDPEAQSVLGELHRKGDGVSQSNSEALYWFRKSAVGGNAIGQFNLAVMIFSGEGVKQDVVEGYKWILRAASSSTMLSKQQDDELVRNQIDAIKKLIESNLTLEQLAEGKRQALAS